jgi:murein DD-endopeptidase MepM/ murein hydrolase activator NlpD
MKKATTLYFLFIYCICLNCISCKQNAVVKDATKLDTIPIIDTVVIEQCIDPVAISFLGIDVDSLCVQEKEFGRKDNLQKLFSKFKLDKNQYQQFLEESKEYYDFTTIKPKQKYFTITQETDSTTDLHYLVFKVSEFEYVIANCTDTSYVCVESPTVVTPKKSKQKKVKKQKKPVLFHPLHISFFEKSIDTVEILFAAIIQKSVAKTFKENNIDPKLIEKLNKAFGSKFSINGLRKNDTLQFIYDQTSINGQFVDFGHVNAVCVKQKKKKLYAIDYFLEDDSSYQFVDEKGKYLKTAFLKSPLLNGGAIVSRFNLHRFHPVLLVEKAHLGTDFAAPTGAPIIATASGIISNAEFKQYNGNYVKIRHDRMYETQYLHMSRIAKGMQPGRRVQQGQVIGYVGSTGLATGPHVCYRFWKNGEQVDPFKRKIKCC